MAVARIKLSSPNAVELNSICGQIKDISERAGVDMKGPIPLPTKHLRIPCRRSPCGEGTETYERWEMRIHKRVIDMSADERALRLIMRIQIPKGVNMEMEIIE